MEERLLKYLQINNWNILSPLSPLPPQVPFSSLFPILVVYLLFFLTSFIPPHPVSLKTNNKQKKPQKAEGQAGLFGKWTDRKKTCRSGKVAFSILFPNNEFEHKVGLIKAFGIIYN